jgi:DNA-binding transcriptional MocR family regulator
MMDLLFAKRMENLGGSAVREILKLTQKPNIISFAGGLPSPESFPVEELREITDKVYRDYGVQVLQYGITEGYQPLLEFLSGWLKTAKHIEAEPEEIQITSGSQQGIDLVSKVFLNAGDEVVIESPSYLSAFQVFNLYRAKYIPIDSDEEGMKTDTLGKLLEEGHRPKIVYTVATYQNPTGITLSMDRRKALLELADKYNFFIIEDNPYGELAFDGEEIPTLKSLDKTGRVFYLGSFSKIVSPGLRLGYVVAKPEIRKKITVAKQASDVHSSNLSQYIIYEYCRRGCLPAQIKKICALYKVKRDAMLKALEESFPAEAGWTRPQGGLFIWVELPQTCNCTDLLARAVSRGVAFVPGNPFFVDNSGQNTMRLNFSNASLDQINEGIGMLGTVIKEYLKR